METIRVRAYVKGRVQGVFFRASTQKQARALRVVGWVRNRPDGAVELEAEGSREAVERLIAWCRRGPPDACVDQLHTEPCEATGREAAFDIVS